MRRPLRHRFLALVVLVPLLALGAEAVVWLVASRELEAGFRDWVAARRSEGWKIATGAEQLGGWPFAAVVTIAGFAISGGEDLVPGGLAWRSDRLALRVDLLAPGKLLLRPAGAERFRIAGSPELALVARRLEAALPAGGASREVDITAADVRLGTAGLAPDLVRAGALTIETTLASGTGVSAEAVRPEFLLHLQATRVTAARIHLPTLGPDIALVSLSAAMTGPLPSGPAWASGLGAWRDGGGMLTVRDLSLVWGPLAVGAAGRLALDAAMQPAGEGTARIVGYAATLDAMVADGSIGRGAATAAKAVLMLLARPSTIAGAPPEVDVPLRLEDRTLSVGTIPLIRFPAVSWP